VDLVLASHDNHPDNVDDRGSGLALATRLVLTTTWRAALCGCCLDGLSRDRQRRLRGHPAG